MAKITIVMEDDPDKDTLTVNMNIEENDPEVGVTTPAKQLGLIVANYIQQMTKTQEDYGTMTYGAEEDTSGVNQEVS